jgi:hypothetical protein
MNEHYTFRQLSLTVSDPDYVGTGNGVRNPLRTILSVFFVSIIACWAAQELLPGSTDILYHVAWLVFHVAFVGDLGMLYRNFLFVLSIILCAVGGDIVRRRGIHIPRIAMVAFHLVYITGLVASFILL